MIFRGRLASRAYTVSLTEQAMTVSRGDTEVAAYDRGGRLYSFYRDPDTFRRGLSGRLLHKCHGTEGRVREWLSMSEADRVVDGAADLAAEVLAALDQAAWQWDGPPDLTAREALTAALQSGASFHQDRAREDAERFATVYSAIGILPPDQYLALVLQATEGCSFNSCTFCDLYSHSYNVRTVAGFRQHIVAVRAYMGASIALRRRSIFLGAANALAVPMDRLSALFEVIRSEFGGMRAPPVHAFVDAFTGVRKTAADYRTLRALGLARVYIGLESGHDPLLAFARKPGSADQALETVRAVKAAGVRVGVIVMIGLGGDRFAEGHLRDTTAVVGAMNLEAGDLIYLSDLVEVPGTAYPALAASEGVRPLDAAARQDQRDRLRAGLVFPGPPPRIAAYDIREFVY